MKLLMDQYNKIIISLWEEYRETEPIAPLLYPPLWKNSILFIGLNPSFNETYIRKLTNAENVQEYYAFKNWNTNSDKWVKHEQESKEGNYGYSYFKKFIDIQNHINKILKSSKRWEHIDLFYNRITSQKVLVKKLGLNVGLTEFAEKQLEITDRILNELSPEIIIVANAQAARTFKEHYNPVWVNALGCYQTRLSGTTVQTHLTGMLTGQRALDNESFKSLKWLITRAYAHPVHDIHIRKAK